MASSQAEKLVLLEIGKVSFLILKPCMCLFSSD